MTVSADRILSRWLKFGSAPTLERTPAIVEARLWPGPQVGQVAEEALRDGA